MIDTSGTVLLGPADAYQEAARSEPALPRIVTAALAGARSEPSGEWAPWDDSALVVAEPVGRDSEVVGAVVTISDLSKTRDRILVRWAQLAGLGLLPLIALVAVAWPVSAWVLRPVRELDAATSRISQGDLTIRADAEAGPVELRRLAESFNTMMDAVENAVQRQRAFVSDASHQLRNPLTSLRLAVESLEPHLSPAGNGRQVYDVAVDELKAMQRMLNSLQASARMESMRTASPVDLDAVLATRVDRWRALTATAGQTLAVDVPPGLRLLEPPGGLGSILDELISNALRLSDAQVVEVTARGRTRRRRTWSRSPSATTAGGSTRPSGPRRYGGSGGRRGTRTCPGPAWDWRSAPTWSGRPGASCGWRRACRVRTDPGTDSPRWWRCRSFRGVGAEPVVPAVSACGRGTRRPRPDGAGSTRWRSRYAR